MEHHELLQQYRDNRKHTDPKFLKLVGNPVLFNLYLLGKLPMGFMAGLKVKQISAAHCQITVPYRWLNQNPFNSTYFAVLSMAAEMSTGMLALMVTKDSRPSVSMLVTHLEADFTKKATGITTFTSQDGKLISDAAERAVFTGEGQSVLTTSTGTSAQGETEAVFKIQWSFKARLKT